MSRIRSVHPGLSSDEAFMSMSMTAKAAWPLLWTQCDDHGVFEWKPIVLKARLFPADNVDFAAVLSEYESLDCIRKVEAGGRTYGLIRNFRKYQNPKHPSYKHPFSPEWGEYVSFKDRDSGSHPPAHPQAGVKSLADEVGEGEEVEEGQERNSSRSETEKITDEFEIWYAAYPKRVGRGAALRAYRSARKKADAEVLLAGARSAGEQYAQSDPKFIPYPGTWLNGERWLDQTQQEKPHVKQNDWRRGAI